MPQLHRLPLLLLPLVLLLGGSAHADTGVNPNAARLCYSCAGINCQRTTTQNATMLCTNVLDYCVTIFDDLSVLARGCYSEIPEAVRRPCDLNRSTCQKCFGQLCNNKGRADVQCIACSSSETSKCASNAASLTPQQCDAPTALNTYCYVRETTPGSIKRGCAVHQTEQLDCQADASCSLCLPSDASACNSYALSAESAATVSTLQRAVFVGVAAAAYALRAAL